MNSRLWLDAGTLLVAFAAGAALVHRLGRSRPRVGAVSRKGQRDLALTLSAAASGASPSARPQQQLPLRDFEAIRRDTPCGELLVSIERRTRLSTANFERDCLPVLRAYAEFVQFLSASEAHHHAQPGGLWLHSLEVVDAALTFRAGQELPPGVSTEERKRSEHRWTYAVFAAALLHDVGKPVTDVRVMLYGNDARAGRPWAPLAGSMSDFGAGWYSVAFVDPSERDYKAHSKLPGILLHAFVEGRVLRWLAEEGDLLSQLLAYLCGDEPDGVLGSIIKRADSDSVRRNLLHGSRTRFSTARTRPLIERLMEALRRMLQDGGVLPLNRPGAAGWVYERKLWFVCARLADEVRKYLAEHESPQGIPGKDRNDRLFDTWQEHGAVVSAPDGGAVWRVRVDCDAWSPPDHLTVLCFPLERLYASPADYPAEMVGRIWTDNNVQATKAGKAARTSAATVDAPADSPAVEPAPGPVHWATPAPVDEPITVTGPAVANANAVAAIPAAAVAVTEAEPHPAAPPAQTLGQPSAPPRKAATHAEPVARAVVPASVVAAQPEVTAAATDNDDTLDREDTAAEEFRGQRATSTPELGAPLRPKEKNQRVPAGSQLPGGSLAKGPSAAAAAFMAWVANAVGSGALKYNEEGAAVHFVPEGALLLSPEVFRKFLVEHQDLSDGPVAALRASHGERALARLQNEFAKSGWTVRNGDENLHYYAFLKADKQLSRAASFFLVAKPALFWNPVPAPNERIRVAPRPKKMSLPGASPAGGAAGSNAAADGKTLRSAA